MERQRQQTEREQRQTEEQQKANALEEEIRKEQEKLAELERLQRGHLESMVKEENSRKLEQAQ